MQRIIFAIILLLSVGRTSAQDHNVELGIMLGNPTGFNAKYWTGENFAIDAALGYNIRQQNHLLLSTDFLAHPWTIPMEEDMIRIFAGLGADLGFMSELGVSARIPLGAALHISSVPLVLFAEIVPTIRLAGPDRPVWISAYLGLRWHFGG